MKNCKRIFFFTLFCLFCFGCYTRIMFKPDKASHDVPNNGKATVVFMRPSIVAGGVRVEMVEIKNGEMKFIGLLPVGSKIAYSTDPGETKFMAIGWEADFMLANLEAGKTYYSVVRPNYGTGGFAPTPVRSDSSTSFNMNNRNYKTWRDSTYLLEKKPNADDWFQKKIDKYERIYKRYWARFEKKSKKQKLARTLLITDGI